VVLTKAIGGFQVETLLESTFLDMEALGASQWEATVQALSLLLPSVAVLPDKGGRSRSKNKGRMWRTKEGNLKEIKGLVSNRGKNSGPWIRMTSSETSNKSKIFK
jgi:hypothetical protein